MTRYPYLRGRAFGLPACGMGVISNSAANTGAVLHAVFALGLGVMGLATRLTDCGIILLNVASALSGVVWLLALGKENERARDAAPEDGGFSVDGNLEFALIVLVGQCHELFLHACPVGVGRRDMR